MRVISANGVSNAGYMWVGLYPDVLEKEPNQPASPQTFETLPVSVNGTLSKPQDVDAYAFQASAGETWVFSLASARYHSAMDGCLSLSDARGRHLQTAMNGFERDPRLVYTFPASGRYVLRVRDSMYRGGPGYTYRLTLGKLPVITRWSPLVGQPGERLRVAVNGVNLADTIGQEILLPRDAGESEVQLVTRTAVGPSSPVPVFLSDDPGLTEQEPNDELKTATRAPSLPRLACGRIDREGDRDLFEFPAAAKQTIYLEVKAHRLGSRLDPVLRVLDAAGKQLALNDDGLGKDSRILFTAPAAGEYYAEVRGVTERGGDDFYYLLRIGDPPLSDFSPAVTPDNPTVPAGAAVPITVTATRSSYNGPIALRLEGLPTGVTASPVSLAEGESSAVFTLTAPAGATSAWGRLHLIGSAQLGGKRVERAAVGQERYQPPLTTTLKEMRMRGTELLMVATGPEPSFTLSGTPSPAVLKAGEKLDLTVKLARKPDYKEEVAVTALGLPKGIKASDLKLKGGDGVGKLTLTADKTLKPGVVSFILQGSAKNLVVTAPATALTIQAVK